MIKKVNIIFTLVLIINISLFSSEIDEPIIWTFKTNAKIMSHPIIEGNIIYFGSMDSVFYAVDNKTGIQLWNYKTSSPVQSKALINNDIVYFKSGNNVFALNKNSGQEIWRSISEDKEGVGKIDLWDYHSGSAAIYKSNIYFGFGNGKLLGFDLQSGEIKHEIKRESDSPIKSGLVIEDSVIYFGDWDGWVNAFNIETNKFVWKHKTYKKQLYSTFGQINTQLSIYNDLLFFGGRNPEMQVLNKKTGEVQWTYIEKEGGWISGDPLVMSDTLYIGGSDNHEMFAFNANTGEKYWTYEFLNNNFSQALAYNNYLLFATGDAYNVYGKSPGKGYVYALNRGDGSIVNFTKVGGNIYSTLIEKNGVLYLAGADGYLYALDLNEFLNEEPKLKTKGYNSIDITGISPSPFKSSTKITYNVNYNAKVNIRIIDLNEEEIVSLGFGNKAKGEHITSWDGKDNKGNIVPDGYYFAELSSGIYFKKVIIQKQRADR
ncbi:MAG: hypothetical protein C0598_05490 [Marinilabiliales bacterium]|nr:MAG: hypothetical protein C0598_05490 [Marinilabiliales bacterium]